MIILKKLNCSSYHDLFIKLKWILSQSKPVIPFLVVTTIINSIFALIGVYNALVTKSLIDSAINKDLSNVIKWLTVMAIIMFSTILTTPILSLVNTHASTNLVQGIQKKLYKHIEYSDWLSQSKYHSISLLTRITSDVSTISSMIFNTIPTVITLLVTLVASFSTLFFLAPSLAIVSIIIAPILAIISKLLGRKLKKLYKEVQEEDVRYRSFMQESLQNIMIVKTFCMEKLNLLTLKSIQKNKYDLAMKNSKTSVITNVSMSLCSSIVYFAIFCWGAINISTGLSTYGTFTAMLQLYGNVQSPLSSLARMFPSFVASIAAAERLMELESIPLEKHYNIDADFDDSFKPSISLNNVSFEYIANKPVLNDINLSIKSGEIIALIGTSGEGKTTIIRLILNLISPSSGEIKFYDQNTSMIIDRNCRQLISYVPQGNTLFSGSIRENLKYGNSSASDLEIADALKKSCALDFVNNLENNIDTIIGEKGLGISEGQAQRISIARSFLRKKPILILDEATASLDPQTEINVLKEIKHLSHKPICIIITHRPSALSICNRIFKLHKGNLTEINKCDLLEAANDQVI